MVDFLMIATRSTKKDVVEIYPKFIIKKSSDLMIRGGDFYAIWIEERNLWSTDEQDALRIIDRELDKFANEHKESFTAHVRVLHMWDAETGMIDHWHKYCQKQMRDSFHMLDENLIFSNTQTTKEDYASKRLNYPLEPGTCESYEKLISTLYSPSERHKIEWAIGSIVSGDSKDIQKFMVLYGAAGTGKSTILNIIQKLFDGYCSVFDAKSLASTSNQFALEAFKNNPLVAIQHDGDLSRIEDNTRLNSLVSHELMTVNEKFKSTYANRFKCFLFMGTNKPVKITDAKSGLIRRLIDVSPSGDKLSPEEYRIAVKHIDFELGAIASHCLDVYREDPDYYDTYTPNAMLGASNDFYNFVLESYYVFEKDNNTTLGASYIMYKNYCNEANVLYPLSRRAFKEELKNYFEDYYERFTFENGERVRNFYQGFKTDKFTEEESEMNGANLYSIELKEQPSLFDETYKDAPAQYASKDEKPLKKWDDVKTNLSQLDTTKLHYLLLPENHIVIDFDLKDDEGNKDIKRNLDAASKFPKTYAELSKSGNGIHLHYIYTGDPEKLMKLYTTDIEIKTFKGHSSLRRKLTKCNDIPIATISSGLPLKGDKKVVNQETIKSERGLRNLIVRNLNKEIHPSTKSSVDFIYKILSDAYESGLVYDISDMRNAVLAFAAGSTNQSSYCVKLVSKMKFKSEDPNVINSDSSGDIVFYDLEVFPNLVLVNWKYAGDDQPVHRMINPKPIEIGGLIKNKLIGFNCRRYDNHILYAILMGYSVEQVYNLSQKIISGDRNAFFREAYYLSYTDVYDFASAGNKKSLKKLEIEMGIHHQELGLPWDKPVDEDLWDKVAEYCDNDVIATEAAFNYLKADWTARQILADLSGLTVNDTTNAHTTRIIFGKERKPQSEFNYRDLGKPYLTIDVDVLEFLRKSCPGMIADTLEPNASVLPYFDGYSYDNGVSTYRGETVGEGGYVYAEPGMYTDVALLDVSSMHPHSIIAECLFGVKYTTIFKELVDGRVDIKHEDWLMVNDLLDGKLTPHIKKVQNGEMTSKELANALKTAINSVYGLTSANFDNPFRDTRNVDNIVAKRGALFMIDLKYEVQKRGFTVAHIKTDSIKIPGATPEIIEFVMDFGKKYGYSFEHEATYEKMCLVNNAVYVAKYASPDWCEEHYGYLPGDNKKKGGKWTATGAQFQVPYVFKTLFSKEPIKFEDMCETKAVTSSLYLDMNEDLPEFSAEDEKELDKIDKAWHADSPEPLHELAVHLGYSNEEIGARYAELCDKEAATHNYIFIGRVGQFCPIKPGCGGGYLVREKDGKYYAATGAKGYRWLESEMVRTMDKGDDIDIRYYQELVTEAIETISKYGDFEWFAEEDIPF